jgi:glycosyltransferase involved in cell wall biosynthesis
MGGKRVLIIPTWPGWSFDNTANAIVKHLGHYYEFDKIFDDPEEGYRAEFNHEDYDVIFCLWWNNILPQKFNIPREKLVVGLYSYWSWQHYLPMSPEELNRNYLSNYRAVAANCPGLFELFSQLHPHVFLTPDGVDSHFFYPHPGRRSDDDSLVVGWAGSVALQRGKKGFEDYILPAVEGLEGVNLETAIREVHNLSYQEMPDFYNKTDVYICASITEGTPNPVLEAASCGRALLSTWVGIVPMLLQDGVNGFVIERDITDIRNKICILRDNRELCRQMGRVNRESIEREWDWSKRVLAFKEIFDFILFS